MNYNGVLFKGIYQNKKLFHKLFHIMISIACAIFALFLHQGCQLFGFPVDRGIFKLILKFDIHKLYLA